MKRYDMQIFEGHKSRATVVTPVEAESGQWVNYADVATLEARLKEAVNMLNEAHNHLDYCGYGDEWEQECADERKLDERITKVLDKNKELLEDAA